MVKGDIETYFEDGAWKNRPQGNERAFNNTPRKSEAQQKGREMAKDRKGEHVIKKKYGTIGQRNSYKRPDPYPRRDSAARASHGIVGGRVDA